MITLLGSLLGFLSAAFPDFLKLFRDAQDRKHELKILELQMQQQAQGVFVVEGGERGAGDVGAHDERHERRSPHGPRARGGRRERVVGHPRRLG